MKKMILFVGIMAMIVEYASGSDWTPVEGDIMTRWARQVNPGNVHSSYPRPQMVREDWLNLNGLWDYAVRAKNENQPRKYQGKILVPFPIESALSGVKKTVTEKERVWYRRTFEIPREWQQRRILIHFGAVDWETNLWVNGVKIGTHKGGYDAFSFDITNALSKTAEQEIVVSVWDPTDAGYQPRGKQVKNPRGIWYTAVTGIWQTVWLEPVNETFIRSLKITPNIDESEIIVKPVIHGGDADYQIIVSVKDGETCLTERKEKVDQSLIININNPKLWSPDSPFLYDLEVALKDGNGKTVDSVASYFGMRKIALGKDDKGITRLFLNNEQIFMHGPLDQGWWPDGLYTAPTDEALRYDIEVTKKLGFNMARKHVKIEPARWYYWCDKLGLLVWQDMPSGDRYIRPNEPDIERSEESAAQFKLELKRMIDGFYNHPCIVMWVPYNEGWGQYDTEGIVKWIKQYDPTRLVDNASGWTDRGVGDVHDIHSYPGPAAPPNEPQRAAVLGEYGGLGLPVPGHTWREKKNWGYRRYKTAEDLINAYQELSRKLQPLIRNGLCAAVYTQTTDVEIEVNGLMTYDRAIIKMDPERLAFINAGYLPPEIISDAEIFLDEAKVEIKSMRDGEIRYTTDGSDPTRHSELYRAPLVFKNTTTIKARLFWDNDKCTDVSCFTCKKVKLTDPVLVKKPLPGMKANYYEGAYTELPDFSKLKPIFSKVTGEFGLNLSPRETDFALKFQGYIKIFKDGIYTFSTNSDDGSRLYVAGQHLIENDGVHGMNEKYGKIALKAGFHPIRAEFFQHLGGRGFEVYYEGPGIKRQQIPGSVLFH